MSFLERIFRWVVRGFRALARLAGALAGISSGGPGLSLPAKIALVVALVVLLMLIIAPFAGRLSGFIDVAVDPGWLWYIVLGIFLQIAIPFVVYLTVRLLLQGDVSPFEDIDTAWKQCLEALAANDLDVRNIPIFIILGSGGDTKDKALLDAAGLTFRVEEPSQGGGWPLRCYASPEGIYIALTDVGCLGPVIGRGAGALCAAGIDAAPAGRQASLVRETLEAPDAGAETGIESPPSSFPGSAGQDIRGTLDSDDIRGTMMSDGESAAVVRNVAMSNEETATNSARLEYVCRLIRRERHPICPINGVLTLLPFGQIRESEQNAQQIQNALAADTATLRKTLELRCAVIALVIGLDEESGFRELLRRVSRPRQEKQRFGKGFNVWNAPHLENIDALCVHTCAQFEDWTYHLFRNNDALSRPGNKQLYLLLCKVRGDFQARLRKILEAGFGYDPERQTANDALLFSGCYFAAAGDQPDRQAFVRGVVDKLHDQEAELEWTQGALIQEQRRRRLARAVTTVDALLLGVLVVLLVGFYWLEWGAT